MNSKIIIIGGKGTACVVAEQIIHAISNFGLKDEILGFVFKDETMDNVLGYPIVSRDYFELAEKYEKYDDVKFLYQLYRYDKIKARSEFRDSFNIPVEKYYNFIHPLAYIAGSAKIGYGNIFLENTVINSNAVLENFNTFNSGCHVAHDTIIGNSNFSAAHTSIGSGLHIGDNNFFGINCTLKNNIIVGDNNLIGQHSNVVKCLKDNIIAYGNPAREKGYNDPNKECWD